MEVSPPPVQETGPVNTRSISMVPPPNQDTASPSSTLSSMSTLPTAWLPIIARDQAVTGTSQQPNSDAYLSGQPSKRRRLNMECKPRGQVRRMIEQSLQQAMDQTGLQPTGGAAVVMEQVVASRSVQEAVEQMTRDSFQERSRDGEADFQAEKFKERAGGRGADDQGQFPGEK